MFSLDITAEKDSISPGSVWNDCLEIIKKKIPALPYTTWFEPIKPTGLNGMHLKVELPNSLSWEWIEERYSTIIKEALSQVLGSGATLDLDIAAEAAPAVHTAFTQAPPAQNAHRQEPEPEFDDSPVFEQDFEISLNPRYVFNSFIKGAGNELAYAASQAISDNPGGTSFNPFFVYGGVGLGKTHLIQAVGNSIISRNADKKVIYISSDEFTVKFVAAIGKNRTNEFSNMYRTADVLIIDDIQFLRGKEKTQDLFFHIFNSLHQTGKQIILSSDKPPKDLDGLDNRLISRFHWGLAADVQPPDYETRIAILNKKAELFGINLPPEIIDYIASHITSNIRELEGCLIKLLANSSLNSKQIDLELTKRTVKQIATNRKVIISIDLITRVVCEVLDVDEKKIRDKTRKQEIVNARQISMFLSKQMTNSSLKMIGLQFGGRDHSTVIHACESVEQTVQKDSKFSELIEEIKHKIEIAGM